MNKHSKNKLKQSIQALNLNEPYALPKESLSFIEPSQKIESKKVIKKEPVVKTTTGNFNHPSDKPVVEPTTPIDQPVVKPTTGQNNKNIATFMIPHHIFEQVNQMPLSKNELKVLNCLLRFTLGFHRSTCEAGLSFISKWTGIKDKNNISKTLKRLLDKKYVKKVKEYDSKKQKGTIYEVSIIKNYYDKSHKTKQPVVKPTSGVKLPPPSGRNNHSPGVDLTPKKENPNKNTKKTLSPEIESHFKTLTKRKQSSETLALEELLETFTPEQVSEGFTYIQKNGDLSQGKTVHSPFRYLAIAMDNVLAKVAIEKSKIKQISKQTEASKTLEVETDQFETEALEAKRKEFFITFPKKKDRDQEIKNIIKKIPFPVPVKFAEDAAINRWYEDTKLTNTEEKSA